jgi:hypothetical protein
MAWMAAASNPTEVASACAHHCRLEPDAGAHDEMGGGRKFIE